MVTLKDTSLGYVITYEELLLQRRQIAINTVVNGDNPYVPVIIVIGADLHRDVSGPLRPRHLDRAARPARQDRHPGRGRRRSRSAAADGLDAVRSARAPEQPGRARPAEATGSRRAVARAPPPVAA